MSANRGAIAGLTRITRTSVRDQTLEQLKNYIISGELEPGGRLPSERALSEALGVGRYSVREALKILEAVGLVEARIGDGTFLARRTGEQFGRILGMGLAVWGGTIIEILDAREMIEVEAARAAAERATQQDLAGMRHELERMQRCVQEQNIPEYLSADMEFHRRIARASHNAIIWQFVNNLADLLEEVLQEANFDEIPTQAEGGASHQDICQAIAGRDRQVAATLMRRHIQFTTEVWQTMISLTAQKDRSREGGSDKEQPSLAMPGKQTAGEFK